MDLQEKLRVIGKLLCDDDNLGKDIDAAKVE